MYTTHLSTQPVQKHGKGCLIFPTHVAMECGRINTLVFLQVLTEAVDRYGEGHHVAATHQSFLYCTEC